MKGDAIARAFGVFHSAQPTFCTVNPEFGEVSAQKIGVESKSHRFDAEGGPVLNAADFECSDAGPIGRGERSGEIGDKKKKMEWDRGEGHKEEQNRS